MTLNQLITEVRSIINQTDENNSQITNSQITGWINEGIRYILTKMKDVPRTEKNIISSVGDINIDDNTLTIEEAYIYDTTNDKYKKLNIIDIGVLQHLTSDWLNTPAGEPEYFCRKSTFTYYLYPQPTSEWQDVNIKYFGMVFPAVLASPIDEPSYLPKVLQDTIPHYAAFKCFSQMGISDRANNELIFFRSSVKGVLEISTVGSSQNRKFIMTENPDGE